MIRLIPLLAAISLLVSCGSPAKSFYTLSAEGRPPTTSGVGVGVGPIALAEYLDRPNLVFQETGNRLIISESHRWAGDLEQNVSRVVASNLGALLSTGNVRTYPWDGDAGLRYQVTLDIRQLHGDENGDAVLDATYRVYALPERSIVATRSWSGTEPLEKDGYESLVSAQSRLLQRLSAEIVSYMGTRGR